MNPLCQGCNHPRSLHGKPPGPCKGIGCACAKYVKKEEGR